MIHPHRLSNVQRKELTVRQRLLKLALPLPLDFPDDPSPPELIRFAVASLPEDILYTSWIRAIRDDMITIAANSMGAHPFGVIVMDQSMLTLSVSVVLIDLSVTDKPRNSPTRLQWPGDVIIPARNEVENTTA